MQRPKIDRTKTYKRVRRSSVQVGDAITRDHSPGPGSPYYRVTSVQHYPTRVLGYYVGTKKREDSGRTSKNITDVFKDGNPYLLERKAAEPSRAVKKAEPKTPEPELPEQPKLQIMVVNNDGEKSVTLARAGQDSLFARDDHPFWADIWRKVCADELDGLADLFDVPRSVEIKFQRLSERVTVKKGVLYLDHDPIDDSLARTILRFLDEGRTDWGALVSFFEYVQANPSQHSREQLFKFLDANNTSITQDGLIVAYKGVYRTSGGFESTRSGPAIVNGEEHTGGKVPNDIGSLIELPRSTVVDRPTEHCSVGLHVAAIGYASTGPMGGDAVLEVHVNPRDVVSVPNDYNAQKVRCCRYKVVAEVPKGSTSDAPGSVKL